MGNDPENDQLDSNTIHNAHNSGSICFHLATQNCFYVTEHSG